MTKPIQSKDHHSTEKLGYKTHDKKDGAGKGGWGKTVEDSIDQGPALDPKDPNYDSGEEK